MRQLEKAETGGKRISAAVGALGLGGLIGVAALCMGGSAIAQESRFCAQSSELIVDGLQISAALASDDPNRMIETIGTLQIRVDQGMVEPEDASMGPLVDRLIGLADMSVVGTPAAAETAVEVSLVTIELARNAVAACDQPLISYVAATRDAELTPAARRSCAAIAMRLAAFDELKRIAAGGEGDEAGAVDNLSGVIILRVNTDMETAGWPAPVIAAMDMFSDGQWYGVPAAAIVAELSDSAEIMRGQLDGQCS